MVRSNGTQTFNIFDTRGLPLCAQHLASATALCHLLVDRVQDEDKDKLRGAVLAEMISTLYGVECRAWRKDHPEAHYELCREAAALLKFQQEKLSSSEGLLDAFLLARELRAGDPNSCIATTHAVSSADDPHAPICAPVFVMFLIQMN